MKERRVIYSWLFLFSFISHMVQMKGDSARLLASALLSFISHMVQMKVFANFKKNS